MKKLFVFAGMLLAVTTFAQSHEGHDHEGHNHGSKGNKEQKAKMTPEEKAQKMADRWQAKLGLSDDEKAKFFEAKKKQMAARQELRKTKPVDKTKIQAINADFDASVKAAFTPEHYTAWKAAKEEAKKKHDEKKAAKGKGKGNGKGKGQNGKNKMKSSDKSVDEKSKPESEDKDDDESDD
jgi:periplasmic protein CpxP/Spy